MESRRNTRLLLGIDIGTSSSKGVLVDAADGTVVAEASRAHETSRPRPGWFEHDAEMVWWADVVALARRLLAAVPGGAVPGGGIGNGAVAGVCVSGIGPCLLPASTDGAPLRPAVLYGVDTRAGAQIAAQTERYGAERVLERCGAPLTSQAVGPKLAWLRECEPEVYARTRRWYMASSWVVGRLTGGAYVLDHHSASQCTPLYDLRARRWIEDWREEIAPGLEWPELVRPAEVVGRVTAAAAEATGIPAGTPVTAGTVDAWSESVGAGATRDGDVMLMYGTTMFLVNAVGAEPVVDPRLWAAAGAFEGGYSLAGGMATSGAVTGWLRDLTGSDYATLTQEAAEVPPGGEGLLMLPYFAGERTPVFDPDARGVLAGLTLRHGRAHLYRAALEATAFGVRHNLEAMQEAGGDLRRLLAVGGGARELWTRIVSDVTGRTQQIPRRTVGAAYGDAFLAAVGAGLAAREDIHAWNPVVSTVEPDPAVHETYEDLYRGYLALYPATRDLMHSLTEQASGPGHEKQGE